MKVRIRGFVFLFYTKADTLMVLSGFFSRGLFAVLPVLLACKKFPPDDPFLSSSYLHHNMQVLLELKKSDLDLNTQHLQCDVLAQPD